MTTAAALCERGFLPRELPPPFTSAPFGALIGNGWTPRAIKSSAAGVHNLFRWATLRRELTIPNPLAYAALARTLEQRWNDLQPIFSLSPWSLSRPTVAQRRAIEPRRRYRILLLARARCRAGNRYAVRADIARFYHSVYTHTLEWAIHTKSAVKANRGLPPARQRKLWGSELDNCHRVIQDRQSVGIPVGPDSSLIASEALLSRIDEAICGNIACRGVRYIDDYELCFSTLADAERGLATLQQALADYELALNPNKTSIIELPSPLEPGWIRSLRRIALRKAGSGQRYDYVDLFDMAFELTRSVTDGHVLRFTMGVVRHATCLPQNWTIVESLLLQGMAAEPGIIREVLSELVRYRAIGRTLNLDRIAETLHNIIIRHAPLGHGSEVAWALWAHIQLGLTLDEKALVAVEAMDDSVVVLTALDASRRGLTTRAAASNVWSNMISPSSLLDSNWLLAYEAHVKGWMHNRHLASDADFAAMRNAGVEFYRELSDPSESEIDLSPPGGGEYP